jgi:cytochrome c oxidase subunit 7c
MPFDYRNRKTLAVKVVIFFATGFSIPFVAAKYQL